jgi:hypothetical protein
MARAWSLLTIGPGPGKPDFRSFVRSFVPLFDGFDGFYWIGLHGREESTKRNHAVRTMYLVSRMRRETHGSYRPRRSRPSLRMETNFRAPLCIWRICLRGHSKVNSHSLGGWEEARRRCICYHSGFLDLGEKVLLPRVRMGSSREVPDLGYFYSTLDVRRNVNTRTLVSWVRLWSGHWPVVSSSAVSVLGRREGGKAVFSDKGRTQPQPAFRRERKINPD